MLSCIHLVPDDRFGIEADSNNDEVVDDCVACGGGCGAGDRSSTISSSASPVRVLICLIVDASTSFGAGAVGDESLVVPDEDNNNVDAGMLCSVLDALTLGAA